MATTVLSSGLIADLAVVTAKLGSKAVTAAKIADGGVGTTQLADSAVTTGKINIAAVTTAKVADGNVTTDKLAAGAVTADKLGTNAVTTAKVADGNITGSKLASGLVSPTGMIAPFGMGSVPSGWLECNGAAVSRTTYATLFAAIGTNYGNGDGSTTFNLPDARGRFLRGWDHGAGNDPDAGSRTAQTGGGATGDAVGSVQADGVMAHVHQWYDFSATNANAQSYDSSGNANDISVQTNGVGDNLNAFSSGDVLAEDCYTDQQAATGTSGETRPKNLGVMYCIKT